MANDLTTQTATLATVPTSSKIATVDLGGAGRHAQVVLIGGATTGTTSAVNDSASSAQMLAANTSRVGATFYNDSPAVAYVKCGTTASSTDFTVKMDPYSYFEVPYGYNGRIDAIWASDQSGAMRITEFT